MKKAAVLMVILVASFLLTFCSYVIIQKLGFGFFYTTYRTLLKGNEIPKGDDIRFVNLDDCCISGLPYCRTEGNLTRIPKNYKSRIRDVLWTLSEMPSGGRIRFKTDAKSIYVKAVCGSATTTFNMSSIGKTGVDLYVDNEYRGSAWPDLFGRINKRFDFGNDTTYKNVTIYLPLYETIQVDSIGLSPLAKVLPPDDLIEKAPIIFYGSSITQGGGASNPGMSYPAILSRRLGIDFINLGFSGNGIGDIEIAEYIGGIESSMIVLDYAANPPIEVYSDSLPKFVKRMREHCPSTPILVVSPTYSVGRTETQQQKRKIAQDYVQQANYSGDANIFFFDGYKMISPNEASGLSDGRHPNSFGYYLCAIALEETISVILQKHNHNDTTTTSHVY